MTDYVHHTEATPLGDLTVVMTPEGVHRIFFSDVQDQHAGDIGSTDPEACSSVHAQLAEYFEGSRTTFEIDRAPTGTAFQHQVWDTLLQVPFGQIQSYGEIAETLGKPTASRAVGAANGKNPLAIIVPCHRIVGASGALTGYNGGMHRKRWLLHHEGVLKSIESDSLDDGAGGLRSAATHCDQTELSISTL